MNINMKKPTIKDVAEKASVSVATVSRILNGLEGYSEETREKVNAVVEEMGYRRNAIAMNLKTKTTRTIGVLIPKVETTFYLDILNGIEDMAHENNYSVFICTTGFSSNLMPYYLNVLSERQVDGIIVCSLSPKDMYDKNIVATKIPCILVSTFSPRFPLPYIKVDDFQAAFAATSYLIENGHTKIAMLGGDKDDPIAGMLRLEGYTKALKEHNISVHESLIKQYGFSFKEGKKAMEALLSENIKFTAIFATCDDIAVGAMSIAHKRGISIPKDLSIIGYDNTKVAEMAYPPLTTIAQPAYEMGQKSVEMLIKTITTSKKSESIIMPFEIIERETVKKLK